MENNLVNLLNSFRNDNRIILQLQSYDLEEIINIALREKMYDVFVKLFKPIEIDGVVKIYYDYFSYMDGRFDTVYVQNDVDDEIKKDIESQIYSLDIDSIRRIKICDSKARQVSGWNHPVNTERDVIFYAEPACIEAMLYLFRNNVITTMNDTECVSDDPYEENGKCVVWINYELLDEENKKLVDDYISIGLAHFVERESVRTIAIEVPCNRNETVGDVSDRLMEYVSKFKIQDVKYEIFSDEVVYKHAISHLKIRIKWRLINFEYEDLVNYFIEYFKTFDEQEYPDISDTIDALKNGEYEMYQLTSYMLNEDEMLEFIATKEVDKMSKEERTNMVLDSCYLDVENGLLFGSELAYLKHKNYLAEVSKNKLSENVTKD